MSRGMLTTEVKKLSLELLGYELETRELRLMPYFQHIMMNSQEIDRSKITSEERKILTKWESKGWIEKGRPMSCTKEFWESLNKIMYVAYVNRDN